MCIHGTLQRTYVYITFERKKTPIPFVSKRKNNIQQKYIIRETNRKKETRKM